MEIFLIGVEISFFIDEPNRWAKAKMYGSRFFQYGYADDAVQIADWT
jgi:hypothetical protein